MDVVGSEIGQKMRAAIKAKLTELGCYVDDELPDYVMVMVANKRTRSQMEEDLQLFLGDNTVLFVNWLHQVLKKLQEVTVTTPIKYSDIDKNKEALSKEKKSKDKKDKSKKRDSSKKKKKEKSHKRKDGKKIHKSKKKSKHHEMIRPNIPPLLMNMEKNSEPSITDVFAGQILKNHGVTIDSPKDDLKIPDTKQSSNENKRPILPIIDLETITPQLVQVEIGASQMDQSELQKPSKLDPSLADTFKSNDGNEPADVDGTNDKNMPKPEISRNEQIKEMNEIETKIQGLKQKLAEQLDSLSDDEDFLNIRTEAEELMNDFAEDVLQEITAPVTPPSVSRVKSISPAALSVTIPNKEAQKDFFGVLPQIELNLPKRPIRERLGVRDSTQKMLEIREAQKKTNSERFTPEIEPECFAKTKTAKTRTSDRPDSRISPISDISLKSDATSKRLNSKISMLDNRVSRGSCASVVRVRPRPRAPASSLLLRAVADAHKSLLNIPPKVEVDTQKVKRALVRPMRRCVDTQNIVIQVPGDESRRKTLVNPNLDEDYSDKEDERSKRSTDSLEVDDSPNPAKIRKVRKSDHAPLQRKEICMATKRDDRLMVESINIHHQTVDKAKDTKFIVTMDGYHPNAFLAKKLLTEGLLDDADLDKPTKEKRKPKKISEKRKEEENVVSVEEAALMKSKTEKVDMNSEAIHSKRLSNTSEESDTQVIITKGEAPKRVNDSSTEDPVIPEVKKRKASPIVFKADKKESVPKEESVSEENERKRTDSGSSESYVVATAHKLSKYDTVPPLPTPERKLVWCHTFPLCRFGSACAYAHPRCKFAAACTRRDCMYSHAPQTTSAISPLVVSHVVPAPNFKSVSPAALQTVCKFYPNCVNPVCHYHHPKPCRYGKACLNKLECNFFHSDSPAAKYKYSV